MGSTISAFAVVPLFGAGSVAASVFSILKKDYSEWFAIASIVLTVLLVVLNIVLSSRF